MYFTHDIQRRDVAGSTDWADRVPSDRRVSAENLVTMDGAYTLSRVIAGGRGAGAHLGRGAFGSVQTYRFLGAVVAVKELLAGVDEESIGAFGHLLSRLRHPHA